MVTEFKETASCSQYGQAATELTETMGINKRSAQVQRRQNPNMEKGKLTKCLLLPRKLFATVKGESGICNNFTVNINHNPGHSPHPQVLAKTIWSPCLFVCSFFGIFVAFCLFCFVWEKDTDRI